MVGDARLTIDIRPCRLEDVRWVTAQQVLLNESHQQFDQSYYDPADDAPDEFLMYISKRIDDADFCLLIAEQKGKRVGYCMGWVEQRPPIYRRRVTGYISNTYVVATLRGRGLGCALQQAMENCLKEKHVDFIETHIDTRNSPAVGLIEKLGYRKAWTSFHKDSHTS